MFKIAFLWYLLWTQSSCTETQEPRPPSQNREPQDRSPAVPFFFGYHKTTSVMTCATNGTSVRTQNTSRSRPLYPRFVTINTSRSSSQSRSVQSAGEYLSERRGSTATSVGAFNTDDAIECDASLRRNVSDAIDGAHPSCAATTAKPRNPFCSSTPSMKHLPLMVTWMMVDLDLDDEALVMTTMQPLEPQSSAVRLTSSTCGQESRIRRTCHHFMRKCRNLSVACSF